MVGGTNLPPHPHYYTNVWKISRLCAAISSLVFSKSLLNFATLLILRRFFSCVDGFLLTFPGHTLQAGVPLLHGFYVTDKPRERLRKR